MCSCHFREGNKNNGPEMFKRNEGKLFPTQGSQKKKRKIREIQPHSLPEAEKDQENESSPIKPTSIAETVILQIELENKTKELQDLKEKEKYSREQYSVRGLSSEVIRMETGLPNKEIFDIVVSYTKRFQDDINYFAGWKVETLSLEDQVFITLMKLRQDYTNLHLAKLFHCSTGTIRNIVITFVHLLYVILYEQCMSTVPSRHKNKSSLPGSFSLFGNCRMVIDCTDIRIASPSLMSVQKLTYSSYRGMNSFKALVGVAPNAVITFVSDMYAGSVSDKAIVQKCGILSHLNAGDLILADEGFLIQDMIPSGVSVNIPPFLNNGKFSESEIKVTKGIAKCRIHVERANARLKDFRILGFIPPYLKGYADKVFKLCAALVNLQYPLIKEISDTIEFE